jgi:hypothetical protein
MYRRKFSNIYRWQDKLIKIKLLPLKDISCHQDDQLLFQGEPPISKPPIKLFALRIIAPWRSPKLFYNRS